MFWPRQQFQQAEEKFGSKTILKKEQKFQQAEQEFGSKTIGEKEQKVQKAEGKIVQRRFEKTYKRFSKLKE